MSVCISFRTKLKIESEQILDAFVKSGNKIIVTSAEFPNLKLGTMNEALRGIEINHEEDYGFEVRVCSFANRSDLDLFVDAVEILHRITNVVPLYEDDDDELLTDIREYLNDEWITEQIEGSFDIICVLIKTYGEPIIFDGLFLPICVGPQLINDFGINPLDPNIDCLYELQGFLTQVQWDLSDKEGTSTHIVIKNPEDENGRSYSVSMIIAENGKVRPFDYVSFADILCLMDNKDFKLIHMRDFCKIVGEMFWRFDDFQFKLGGPLGYDSFKRMMLLADYVTVDDLFFNPKYPGEGYEEKQNTFVLMWNPDISSVKLKEFSDAIPNLLTLNWNWSVYDYANAKKGDKFILIRSGSGNTGVVMSGLFDSNPYPGEDWSGRGRKVFM